MDPKWFPPPDRPLQLGERFTAGANLVGIATLLLPQGRFRNVIALPPILYIAYSLRQHTTGRADQDYLNAVNVCLALLKFVDFSILRIPEQTLHRVRSDGTIETVKEIEDMTIWQKLKWNLDLFTTARGIGWNWSVKNTEHVPDAVSRRKFVLEQVLRALVAFLYVDIHEWHLRRTSFGDGSPAPDFFSLPISEQVVFGWYRAFHSGFSMSMGYYLLAAVAVGTGLYRPQSWPPMYGSFIKKGYTMRNIWGSCWHQFLRRTFETYNSVLITALGVKKGTLVSRYLQLYNGFLISALIHHIGSINTPYNPSVKYQFMFFMFQPIAITIEDFAIYLGKKAGIKESWKTRAIGYAWVGAVLSFTLRYSTKFFFDMELGAVRNPIVAKFSIMDRVFG